jgi:thioredoxin-related protein
MKSKKILYFLTGLVIIISCKSEPKQLEWTEGLPTDFSQHDKLIMVDFYADACSPCLRMEKETFTDKNVNQFLVDNFQCYKLNNWKKENKPIQEQYRVYEIPTFVFFNNNGEEIERLTGFMEAHSFLTEITRIEKGTDTYLSLKMKLETEPNNIDLIYQLAEKEAKIGRKGDNASQKMWKRLIEISEPNSYKSDYAKCNFYTGILWKYEQPDTLLILLEQIGDYDFKLDCFKTITDFYNYKKNIEKESIYYRKYTDLLFDNKSIYEGEAFDVYLRNYSSRMAELDINIDDAILKIDYLISKITSETDSTEQAERLYAKSELCLRNADFNESLNLIDRCLQLLPGNEYLIEKKKEIQKELKI